MAKERAILKGPAKAIDWGATCSDYAMANESEFATGCEKANEKAETWVFWRGFSTAPYWDFASAKPRCSPITKGRRMSSQVVLLRTQKRTK